MESKSILNDVLGPIMRGPSSSHTAAPFFIGRIARNLLGDEPRSVTFSFDPGGSFAKVFHAQYSDRGFAAGIMGWNITDDRFDDALEIAESQGVEIVFEIKKLPNAHHPNVVDIQMESEKGQKLHAVALSIGGGAIRFEQVEGWQVSLTGNFYDVLIELDTSSEKEFFKIITGNKKMRLTERLTKGNSVLIHLQFLEPLQEDTLCTLKKIPGLKRIWTSSPIAFVKKGRPLFSNTKEMLAIAEEKKWTLGNVALEYESKLLSLSKDAVLKEFQRRYRIMKQTVQRGFEMDQSSMNLLDSSARNIFRAEMAGRMMTGGIHTRAATRAMAVMEVAGSMGVVIGAPTGGSAGIIPGILVTLEEEYRMKEEEVIMAMLAAGAVGLGVAIQATFAAEVGGCQVEIGAAAAMASAAMIEAAGGDAHQAADAASVSFQNTMGLICDPVQGFAEIPCHIRNALAVSSALVVADLILGGYQNPLPLDEIIDAVYSVGKMLPRELKCTTLGGCAQIPTALKLTSRK